MGKVFVKVNHHSVKFDYCISVMPVPQNLLFHMVENSKMYMKGIKFPMHTDLIYLGPDICIKASQISLIRNPDR